MRKKANGLMNSQSNQPYMPDLLDDITARRRARHDVGGLAQRYGMARGELDKYVVLIDNLHHALMVVKPSDRFAQRLKQDLMGAPHMGVITRIRSLPPRVQIAAGLALMAGFTLLMRRRLLSDTQTTSPREAEVAV
jgi:hypothetical protein